jgi:integrase
MEPMILLLRWDRVFQKIGASADPTVAACHPHRFRDTFAVSLLLKGVSLESVSKLLGHSSIKITERHYAPWVKARQADQAGVDRARDCGRRAEFRGVPPSRAGRRADLPRCRLRG